MIFTQQRNWHTHHSSTIWTILLQKTHSTQKTHTNRRHTAHRRHTQTEDTHIALYNTILLQEQEDETEAAISVSIYRRIAGQNTYICQNNYFMITAAIIWWTA